MRVSKRKDTCCGGVIVADEEIKASLAATLIGRSPIICWSLALMQGCEESLLSWKTIRKQWL